MSQPSDFKLQNRYQFHAVIGQGGTGEVSAAWDTQLERTVAIKRLKVADVNEEAMGATWQEAMRLAAIRHANIVAVYDLGVENGSPYVVMEYVQGETIDARLARTGPLDGEEFGEFARQSLEGLTAAHHAGLLHRDLKPANIMLARQPSGSMLVKVLDFGIARFIDPTATPDPNQQSVTGSIHFVAPEQLNREPVDVRTDLYSLGCVFYFALTGRYPFDGATVLDVIQAHLRHEVRPLGEVRPDVAPEVTQWVMALINRQPELRHATAQQALQHLHAIISVTRRTIAIALPSPSKEMPVEPPPDALAPRARSWWLPVGLGIAATVAAVLAFVPWGTKQTPANLPGQPPAPLADLKSVPAPAPASASIASAPTVPGAPSNPMPAKPVSPPAATGENQKPEVAVAPAPATPVIPKAPVEPPAEIVLRLHGSNTIGARLAPMLAEEFLKREGATSVERIPGKTIEDMTVVAHFSSGAPRAVEIAAHGSATAFEDLASGACDIGLASRQAKTDEVKLCESSGLGDILAPSCEHVLGLDGLAVLVNKKNPVKALTKQQIGDIFAGKITDWAAVGGISGPIRLHARDAKSGTFDTFKSLVLGSNPLNVTASRYEDSNELSDAVAADPQSIGFAGLPYVRQARALAVSDEGTQPFYATRFTVAAEDYILSRRLFLYIPVAPQNPLVAKFVEFSLRPEGQEIVSHAGFVKQTVDLERPVIPAGAPADYAQSVANAERLSVSLRFRSGKNALDNKALRDMDRVCALLTEPGYADRGLLLFGFADPQGAENGNVKVSRERAQYVAKELEARGVKAAVVSGFGSALPVANNTDEAGRQRNRRVELWLRPSKAGPSALR